MTNTAGPALNLFSVCCGVYARLDVEASEARRSLCGRRDQRGREPAAAPWRRCERGAYAQVWVRRPRPGRGYRGERCRCPRGSTQASAGTQGFSSRNDAAHALNASNFSQSSVTNSHGGQAPEDQAAPKAHCRRTRRRASSHLRDRSSKPTDLTWTRRETGRLPVGRPHAGCAAEHGTQPRQVTRLGGVRRRRVLRRRGRAPLLEEAA